MLWSYTSPIGFDTDHILPSSWVETGYFQSFDSNYNKVSCEQDGNNSSHSGNKLSN